MVLRPEFKYYIFCFHSNHLCRIVPHIPPPRKQQTVAGDDTGLVRSDALKSKNAFKPVQLKSSVTDDNCRMVNSPC